MSVRVVVTGIGLVSALGPSLAASWQSLKEGRTAIAPRQPFPELPPYPLAMGDRTPVRWLDLSRQVVAQGIRDAELTLPLPESGVVVGSSRSAQGEWERYARVQQLGKPLDLSPDAWFESLPHAAAIATARQIGACGPVLAPMAACATGIWAISRAVELIRTGRCQRAIAGAVEAPITPLTLTGFSRMGALARHHCAPFDRDRDGLVLGEGAAIFVLESAELAYRRHARIYGEIVSFGLTADAYHGNAPDPEAKGAIAAIDRCLDRARWSPEEIGYIHAHGTSTRLNDATEARMIQQRFAPDLPVSSTKGATGHTLGASGALGTAFCLMALHDGLLPPCVGLRDPEFDLNFVRHPLKRAIDRALCFSFGFGGQNAVLAIAKLT
ncbi:beta-ketoacyl-ACP synthase [Oxynema aestuarii]|uniref:Beta-ketoacyl-ACP synthase n=1 Tax=Oxynema aestuarii AP17 TaxID=2064643 RepID=A0A6H1U1P4_9CYAN|nr:beta-ketoacyl-ACP synthase [Oxynema aestuarii]QIZ72090.1 beta-ketoacyl-ACP synthase [Oxynema aestuarii AP17]